MRIDVIGCGGIGSYLIPVLLKQCQDDEVHIWDGDILEKHNLDRQLFKRTMIGMNKADALAKMYRGCTPHSEYLANVGQMEGSEFIFACPDNMPARLAVLGASDTWDVPSIICGNSYEGASASYYNPNWEGSSLDYRVRYKDSLDDKSDDPLQNCTGEALESSPQLAIANCMSASFGVQLYHFWVNHAKADDDADLFGNSPLEFRSAPSRVKTVLIKEVKEVK